MKSLGVSVTPQQRCIGAAALPSPAFTMEVRCAVLAYWRVSGALHALISRCMFMLLSRRAQSGEGGLVASHHMKPVSEAPAPAPEPAAVAHQPSRSDPLALALATPDVGHPDMRAPTGLAVAPDGVPPSEPQASGGADTSSRPPQPSPLNKHLNVVVSDGMASPGSVPSPGASAGTPRRRRRDRKSTGKATRPTKPKPKAKLKARTPAGRVFSPELDFCAIIRSYEGAVHGAQPKRPRKPDQADAKRSTRMRLREMDTPTTPTTSAGSVARAPVPRPQGCVCTKACVKFGKTKFRPGSARSRRRVVCQCLCRQCYGTSQAREQKLANGVTKRKRGRPRKQPPEKVVDVPVELDRDNVPPTAHRPAVVLLGVTPAEFDFTYEHREFMEM